MQTLEKETGVHPGWINNGGIFMAATKERLDEYRRLMVVRRPNCPKDILGGGVVAHDGGTAQLVHSRAFASAIRFFG